ncbi:hypothetical protein ACWEJ6_46900 [Nonomuraea sp. NPDC004702]
MTATPLTCGGCGQEGRRYRRGLCGSCALTEDLQAVLDDGHGIIRPELLPLFEGMRQMDNPRAGVSWLRRPHVAEMLRALSSHDTAITHETVDAMTPWRSAAYLRDLLMHHGVLPAVDRHLLLFQRWLAEWLTGIDDVEHRRLLERFATWHLLRKLRTIATRQPLGMKRNQDARRVLVQAAAFLSWLDDHHTRLGGCTQADLDAWHATAFLARRPAQAFPRWCMTAGHMPKLAIPTRSTLNPAPISQRQRLALIRKALSDESIPDRDRVIALLVLLYAQPISRILRLTLDDLTRDGDQVLLRLGDPPSPVPEPFAGLLLGYTQTRPNTTTATNRDSHWLFPGRRGGQPLDPTTIQSRLSKLGILAGPGRSAAIRQVVLQTPAPVVARMLGYDEDTAARLATAAGSPWSRYAPGGHEQ